MATRLVPLSAGLVAKAVDEVLDGRITALQVELETSLDPDTCRADLLPWLAYSKGVDVWSPDWDEQTKRSVIRDFLKNARKRGTRPGLVLELGALVNEVTITEWWEEVPEGTAGTATIDVTGGSALYSQTNQDAIAEAAQRSAPHTRQITVVVDFAFDVTAAGAVAFQGNLITPVEGTLQRP